MSTPVDPLTPWLALEREAVWFYPYAGARVRAVAGRARAAAAAHASSRDELLSQIDDDTTTVQPSYDVGPLTTQAQVAAAASDLERRIQAACLRVVDSPRRAMGVAGLRRAARAEMTWTDQPRAFPGLRA